MNTTTADIKSEFRKNTKLLGLGNSITLSFERTDDGCPHIEIVNNCEFHFVVTERGNEFKRRKTKSFDELMFWIFSGITFSKALDYEVENRHPTDDFRRILFAKQLELLGLLSDQWRQREQKNHDKILQNHPYIDTVS